MDLKNTRALAAQCIRDALEQHKHLSVLLPPFKDQCPKKEDAAFLQALVFGVLRWLPRLEFALIQLLERPLKRKDHDLHCLILSALFQLMFLQTPAYACISESVEATRSLGKDWAAKLVNALLRRFVREEPSIQSRIQAHEPAYYAHPAWLIAHLKKAWPDHWQGILEANNAAPPLCIRVNLQQCSLAHYLALLQAQGIAATPLAHTEAGIVIDAPQAIETLPGFARGYCAVQDGASQKIAAFLDLAPGLSVLDACAAPGGKTSLILETEPNLAALWALDRSSHRLALLDENIARLGSSASLKILKADACNTASWWDGVPFDRILLDAPCSATGVIRRHPEIKYARSAADLVDLQDQQRQLLEALWPLLKPQGLLLYTTCSMLPEENEAQISAFVARHSDAEPMRIDCAIGQAQSIGHQLFPGEAAMDGFYYAALNKKQRAGPVQCNALGSKQSQANFRYS